MFVAVFFLGGSWVFFFTPKLGSAFVMFFFVWIFFLTFRTHFFPQVSRIRTHAHQPPTFSPMCFCVFFVLKFGRFILLDFFFPRGLVVTNTPGFFTQLISLQLVAVPNSMSPVGLLTYFFFFFPWTFFSPTPVGVSSNSRVTSFSRSILLLHL